MSALPRSRRSWAQRFERFGFRLATVALAAGLTGLAACGDDDDDEPTLTGTFELTEVDGDDLPTTASETGETLTFTEGTIELDADENWALTIEFEGVTDAFEDNGTYTSEGANIDFSSDVFDDDFTGSVSDNTLTLEYDFDDDGDPETELTFTRE